MNGILADDRAGMPIRGGHCWYVELWGILRVLRRCYGLIISMFSWLLGSFSEFILCVTIGISSSVVLVSGTGPDQLWSKYNKKCV